MHHPTGLVENTLNNQALIPMDVDLFEYDLREVQGGKLLPVEEETGWNEFNEFLTEVWEKRPQKEAQDQRGDWTSGNDERKRRASGQGYLSLDLDKSGQKVLCADACVGTVCFDDIVVNIWPRVFRAKFDSLRNKEDEEIRGLRGVITRNMLHWAARADYFKLSPNHGGSSAPTGVSNFFDAYIWLFAGFTRDLLARQPYWQYQSEIEEGEVLRGRLVMNQYINDCLARGRWHRLVYEHEPFDFDNLLNRIIKRTCKLAQGFCDSPTVKEKLGEILFELDEVEDVFCTARDCDRVHLNRMHTEYQIVLHTCRTILAQCQADNSGRDMKRFCFLLPMDRLFEEYLRTLASEAIGEEDWRLDKSEPFLCQEPSPGAFTIRNDFYFVSPKNSVSSKDSKCIIADAKWKDRAGKEKANHGVSQADMYQMVSYAYRRSCKQVHLLYPAMGGQATNPEPQATFTTWPEHENKQEDKQITIYVWELKVHADDGPKLAKGKNCTNEEDAIKKTFVAMLKVRREKGQRLLPHNKNSVAGGRVSADVTRPGA